VDVVAERNGSRRAAAVSQWRGIAKPCYSLIVHDSVPGAECPVTVIMRHHERLAKICFIIFATLLEPKLVQCFPHAGSHLLLGVPPDTNRELNLPIRQSAHKCCRPVQEDMSSDVRQNDNVRSSAMTRMQ